MREFGHLLVLLLSPVPLSSLVSASNFVSFQHGWSHVDSIWDVGAHYVLMDIVGAEQQDGLRCGGIWRRRKKRYSNHPPGAHLGAYPSTATMICQSRRSWKNFSGSSNFPQERISEPTQTVDMPVPETLRTFLQERLSERTQITVPVPFQEETDEVIKRSILQSAFHSALLNKSLMRRCLRSRSKLWKSQRPLRRGASRSVTSYKLRMCQCLRS